MDDPELRSDETVLVRTNKIHVKTIPFEGILTNQRILLVDRAKNLLPPKEILLNTIRDVKPGENAIRDLTITLSVASTGNEVRQVVMTFPRIAGGNRIKERDEWVRRLDAARKSSIGNTIRKVIPRDQETQRSAPSSSPKIEIVGSPIPTGPAAPPQESPFGTFCTRCGNRVPEGSAFCNRCGNRIVVAGANTPVPVRYAPEPEPVPVKQVARKVRPVEREIDSVEPLIERSSARAPRDPLRPVETDSQPYDEPQPVRSKKTAGATHATRKPLPESEPSLTEKPESPAAKRRFIPRLFSPKCPRPTPVESQPVRAEKPPRKPRKKIGKFVAISVIIILIIAVVAGGVIFLKPNLGIGGFGTDNGTAASTTPAAGGKTPTTTSTPASSQTAGPAVTIERTTAPVTIPATGVYIHVDYIGGWKGTYGPSSEITQITNSGERVFAVANATGVVGASIAKLDGSSHEILVEIYKDGKQLTKGVNAARFGKVTLSVDTATGIAQPPVLGSTA